MYLLKDFFVCVGWNCIAYCYHITIAPPSAYILRVNAFLWPLLQYYVAASHIMLLVVLNSEWYTTEKTILAL